MLQIKRPPTDADGDDVQDPDLDFPVMSRPEFDQLCAVANGGDEAAIVKLRSLFNDYPRLSNELSNLEKAAESTLIARITGGNVAQSEAIRARVELLGPDPPLPLRLAVPAVCVSWLEQQWATTQFCAIRAETRVMATFASKQVEASQRRHAAAMKHFLQVKNLLANKPATVSGQPNEDRRKKNVV